MMQEKIEREPGCSGCELGLTRRDFIRDSAAAALGALLTLGVTVESIAASSRSAETLTYPLPERDGVHIDRPNEVILVRWQNSIYAFSLACPHQHTVLRWIDAGARFQCPKHKSKYQPDGTFISGRATRGMDRFNLKRDGNSIIVDISRLIKQDRDPAGWASAVLRLVP